ncbi:MAG: DUF1345 domain-containing protein [Candidatus Eremiobacteraeota bacterium]|nr:DUF1345 domain-containing protein [Candidatus Eremiobacteraeota bacterium]
MGPNWLVPVLVFAILIPLSLVAPRRVSGEPRAAQIAAMALIAVVNIANVVSLGLLVAQLLTNGKAVTGPELLTSAVAIWLTNVIVFSLWYWELDRGGPDDRLTAQHAPPDFLFPQMSVPGCASEHWSPQFVDYFYVAFTNATAFSPTDTLPLTPWAKLLMLIQSAASLVTLAIVAGRAVNILN